MDGSKAGVSVYSWPPGAKIEQGAELQARLWLHPRTAGTLTLLLLWYYQPSQPNAGMRHRCNPRMCSVVILELHRGSWQTFAHSSIVKAPLLHQLCCLVTLSNIGDGLCMVVLGLLLLGRRLKSAV